MSAGRDIENGSSAAIRLRWCVGKFVYMKGSTQPMHFMELKRFIIDDAVDFSHLFYLRGLRSQIQDDADLDQALRKWMDGTAVKLLGQAVVTMIKAQGGSGTLREFYPGVGLIGEYVRLLLQRDSDSVSLGETSLLAAYQGCGSADQSNKFLVLHADESSIVDYRDDGNPQAILDPGPGVIALYNHNQSMRQDQEPKITLEQFMGKCGGAALVAGRIATGDTDQTHMTVKGRVVVLPSLAAVTRLCRETGQRWYGRFLEGFDAGFLLPDPAAAPTGLLVAGCGPGSDRIPGFDVLE